MEPVEKSPKNLQPIRISQTFRGIHPYMVYTWPGKKRLLQTIKKPKNLQTIKNPKNLQTSEPLMATALGTESSPKLRHAKSNESTRNILLVETNLRGQPGARAARGRTAARVPPSSTHPPRACCYPCCASASQKRRVE